MAQTYTRQSSIADGDTITAALFNNEYNQLLNAFAYSSSSASSTGHRHDGSTAQGGNIYKIGDLDFLNKIEADSTNNRWGIYVEVSSAAVEQIRIQDGAIVPVTDNDIDLGTSSLEFKDAYFDGTVTSDAFAGPLTGDVTGNVSGTAATVTTAAQSNITSLGTLTTLTVDNVIVNGTTIGHTSDTDLMTLADGVLTVAGEVSMTTLDIGGTNVTSTAAELNILDGVTSTAAELNIIDGDTSATSTTLADADRVVVNDGGTMKQVALTDFETYFESSIDTIANFEVTTELQTPLIAFTDGDDAIQIADGGGVTMVAGLTSTASANSLGATSFNDADITNVGDIQLDSITGDGDTNTSITFSGSDVITIAAGGDNQVTFTNGAIVPSTDNDIDLGTSSTEFKDAYFDGTVTTDALVADTADINGGTVDGAIIGGASAAAITGTAITGTSFVIGSADINEAELETIDGVTAGTVAASKAVVVDSNKDIGSFRNITLTGELDAATLDISGDADIDGTLEADAITIGGVTLAETISDTVGAMVTSNTESGITVTYDDSDNTLDFVIGTLNQDTTGTAAVATTVTITDNESTNENNAIVFTSGGDLDGGNLGLESDGDLKYNPSTGTLSATNISVSGTFSTVNSVTMNANNAVVFEGSTADAHETTLSSIDATGDRTINLPNVSGTLPVLAAASATQISSTPEELNILDGATVVVGEINALDLGSTAVGTAIASKAVILDSNKDYTGIRNLTITGELDGATLDISGDADIDGTTNLDVVDIDGAVDMATTLAVAGNVDFNGDLDVDGTTNLDVVDIDGAVDMASTLAVTGIVTLTDDLIIGDGKTIGSASDVDAMTIASNGQVTFTQTLIGTALDISGDADIDGTLETDALTINGSALNYKAFGTSSIMLGDNATGTIDAADNNTGVGVDVFAALTSGDNNVAVGKSALTANTTADYNTAIGMDALKSATTGAQNTMVGALSGDAITTGQYNVGMGIHAVGSTTTASSNTGLGYNALFANTTGADNVAVGANALDANTTGEQNVAVGKDAMSANTTGSNNVAVGELCLDVATTASSNTAVGSRAMGATTTGASNTAVGQGALEANTTASNNTGLGKQALAANTTGTENSAVGSGALRTNTTGNYNTAFGYECLRLATTAANNTAMGHYALGATTTGYRNTAIGATAGDAITTGLANTTMGFESLTTLTTGSNNVAIGEQALANSTTGGNNTAVGRKALKAVTTGTHNDAFGFECADNLTTGHSNTLIGNGITTASVGTSNANGFGIDLVCADNYTTIGQGSADIRTSHGSTSWATVSDKRVKKDIKDSTVGLAFINDLRPVTFNYKNKGDLPKNFKGYEESSTEVYKNSKSQHGFIAQEVKAAIDKHSDIKDGFSMWDDDDPSGQQRVGEAAVIPVLVKAVQELSAQVEELKAQITEEK